LVFTHRRSKKSTFEAEREGEFQLYFSQKKRATLSFRPMETEHQMFVPHEEREKGGSLLSKNLFSPYNVKII